MACSTLSKPAPHRQRAEHHVVVGIHSVGVSLLLECGELVADAAAKLPPFVNHACAQVGLGSALIHGAVTRAGNGIAAELIHFQRRLVAELAINGQEKTIEITI